MLVDVLWGNDNEVNLSPIKNKPIEPHSWRKMYVHLFPVPETQKKAANRCEAERKVSLFSSERPQSHSNRIRWRNIFTPLQSAGRLAERRPLKHSHRRAEEELTEAAAL